jgi:1-acyl-sn-glycerol-3-phosphate acyltransferase
VSRLRFVGRLSRLLLLVPGYLMMHGAWRVVGRPSPWPTRFLAAAARACGVRASLVGEPLRQDVMVVANHLSWLDILILGGTCGCAFVSKAELEGVPVIGWLATLNRTIFIRRDERRAVPAQIAAIQAGMAAGPVAIFPEGTTGDGVTLLPFKPALFGALDPPSPGARLQPVFLDYGNLAAEVAWGEEGGAANARRVLGRVGTIAVRVHCLKPIDPVAAGGRKAIAATARERIEEALGTRTQAQQG